VGRVTLPLPRRERTIVEGRDDGKRTSFVVSQLNDVEVGAVNEIASIYRPRENIVRTEVWLPALIVLAMIGLKSTLNVRVSTSLPTITDCFFSA
jgi:hypothetical protein